MDSMEPKKQGDAALPNDSNPTADLEARLEDMRLGDPSSSPPLSPQHVLVPNAALVPASRTTTQMPQSPPRVLAPTAGVYAQQPGSATEPGAPLYAQPSAATDFSAWGGNANDHPYTSAGLIVPAANANQSASRGPVAGNPDRCHPALQDVRANDLLNVVQRARTADDLEAIVNHLTWNHNNGGVPLMEVAEPMAGEAALKELVRLAALNSRPELVQRLFRCLVDGWIMEQSNGPDLLQHFFTTLDYIHCSIFIAELALPRFWHMVVDTSRFGHLSMIICLDNARYTEQGAALHDMFVIHSVEIARHIVGYQLMRTFFQIGRNDPLRERITERVEDNLVELSMDRCANLVVQACFVPDNRTPSVRLLQRGLQAFLRLRGEQLWVLLQNNNARHVLHRLLHNSHHCSVHRAVSSPEAVELAQRILGVGAGGAEDELISIARQVINESRRWLN